MAPIVSNHAKQTGSDNDHSLLLTPTNRSYRYAFTVKDNRTGSQDYETAVERLKLFGTIHSLVLETEDKHGKPTKPHLHGILETNDKLYYKAVQVTGYRFYFVPIYSAHWQKYITKQTDRIDWTKCQFSHTN